MTDYSVIADDAAIEATHKSLEANGFAVTIVADRTAAKQAALDLLPKGSEVMTMTSKTLEALGLDTIINESDDYAAVRPKLNAMMSDPNKRREMRKLGAAPDYAIGSVHALTQDGHALVASNTGSQLPAYAYSAGTVIWVVGAQKIVKDLSQAGDRLHSYTVPLENERAQQAYGAPTSLNKLLTYYKEPAGRIHIIIVKESLGF